MHGWSCEGPLRGHGRRPPLNHKCITILALCRYTATDAGKKGTGLKVGGSRWQLGPSTVLEGYLLWNARFARYFISMKPCRPGQERTALFNAIEHLPEDDVAVDLLLGASHFGVHVLAVLHQSHLKVAMLTSLAKREGIGGLRYPATVLDCSAD